MAGVVSFPVKLVPKDRRPPHPRYIRPIYRDKTSLEVTAMSTTGRASAAQIAPVLTKEMLATPSISLAMMSLMQTLAKDDSPDMSPPCAALLKCLEEVATKDWLAVLRERT